MRLELELRRRSMASRKYWLWHARGCDRSSVDWLRMCAAQRVPTCPASIRMSPVRFVAWQTLHLLDLRLWRSEVVSGTMKCHWLRAWHETWCWLAVRKGFWRLGNRTAMVLTAQWRCEDRRCLHVWCRAVVDVRCISRSWLAVVWIGEQIYTA